jgi:indolepyruvate ferredoxin oxidoreductase
MAPGEHGLAALTRGLESEGVSRIVICSKDPKQYRKQDLGRGVQVRPADELVDVSRELELVEGVTVLVYDESCANERRRRIKRGLLAPPSEYVLVNKNVCEACGDCGVQSNCMSLQKTTTEFGPKIQVHASSCNQDLSCLKGDCPSFTTVKVRPGTGYRKPVTPPLNDGELIDPPGWPALAQPFHVYMPGVGGTGVLTANAILSFAGLMDGYRIISYDQTGAAQKWGPVLSSLKLVPKNWPDACSNKVGKGRADVYLALDEVASVTADNLVRCSPERTAAVINTDLFPTGEMVRDVWHAVDTETIRTQIAEHVREDAIYTVPARTIAEKLFGDYMMTNLVAIGAAYQVGLLPLSGSAIEAAIDLNGVQVAANTAAFRYGRLWIQDPLRVQDLIEPPPKNCNEERTSRAAALSPSRRRSYNRFNTRIDSAADLDNETRRLLAVRVAELIDYQCVSWAERYLDEVLHVASIESERCPGTYDITHAVARNLYKLMAYKDEYEVARLYLRPEWRTQIRAQFDHPVKSFYHLHPPAVRRLGRTKKLRLGPWFTPVLRILHTGRRLRGTPLDPFGYQASRREERDLIAWYQDLMVRALPALRPLTSATILSLAEVPDLIRGYEKIKSDNIKHARSRVAELLQSLERPTLPMATQT